MAGGKAFIHGTVLQDIHNEGGYVEVYGVVQGEILTDPQGETIIDKDAVIGSGD